jgi:hypothetical protein
MFGSMFVVIVLHFDTALPAIYRSSKLNFSIHRAVWLYLSPGECKIYKDFKLIGFIFGQLLHIFRLNSK